MKTIKLPIFLLFTIVSFNMFAAEKTANLKPENTNKCGVITLYKKPPKTKNIHYAMINSIDGEIVNSKSKSFSLNEGKHVLKVIENIVESSLTRRRGEMKNYKFIEVDIQANKKYALGAKYIRKNRSKLKSGEYWQPVVWSVADVTCVI